MEKIECIRGRSRWRRSLGDARDACFLTSPSFSIHRSICQIFRNQFKQRLPSLIRQAICLIEICLLLCPEQSWNDRTLTAFFIDQSDICPRIRQNDRTVADKCPVTDVNLKPWKSSTDVRFVCLERKLDVQIQQYKKFGRHRIILVYEMSKKVVFLWKIVSLTFFITC